MPSSAPPTQPASPTQPAPAAAAETPATDQPDPAALAPCPFCGGVAYFERFGTPRASCVVACEDCGARMEANEEPPFCGSAWNRRRVPPPAPPTTPAPAPSSPDAPPSDPCPSDPCPSCGGPTRQIVAATYDAPHPARSVRDGVIVGVDWGGARLYCPADGCGWAMNLRPPVLGSVKTP